MILLGLDLMMPASRRRKAQNRTVSSESFSRHRKPISLTDCRTYSYLSATPRSTISRAARSGWLTQMSVAFSMARSARLVATGCLRANSRFAAAMQQKYCDQGRSFPKSISTRPIFFARISWGSGAKAGDEGLTAATFGGGYGLAFQIPQCAYRIVGEQLPASSMEAAENDDRRAHIELHQMAGRIVLGNVDLSFG